MTVRTSDLGSPVQPVRSYANGVLRGNNGEPVLAIRKVNPGLRHTDGRPVLAVYSYGGGANDIRDSVGRPVIGVSTYAGSDDRTEDGRVIHPVAYYDGTTGALLSGMPPSLPLTAYGTGITLGSINADGRYPFTTDASGANRAIGRASAITGDFILEVKVITDISAVFGVDDVEVFAARDISELKENIQTNGGGGANALQVWTGASYSGQRTRNGLFWLERIGDQRYLTTGNEFEGRAVIHGPVAAVDTLERFLAITNISANASFEVRFCKAPLEINNQLLTIGNETVEL